MKFSISLMLCVIGLLSGCKSTHTQTFHKETVVSDYALMVSLASRPKTQDQMMMDLFARRSYQINNQGITLFYLPEGQEDPVNFLSVGQPSDSRPLLPAADFAPESLTISVMGPRTSL